MGNKISIFFDGTWSKPDRYPTVDGDENTNISKLHDAVLEKNKNNLIQKKYYEDGLGSKWYNKIRGGVFGVGLSKKIRHAYEYLIENHNHGDEVFIFGYSRGAYAARSLVGLIRNSGLLYKKNIKRSREAYELYRIRDISADSENAIFFRERYSKEISIKFLGVWDTVGTLGIPLESFEYFNRSLYEFHDTELSGIVKNAFHAVAIDEHREDFSCTLWTPKSKPNQHMEQVWFSGAHGNIGGGYKENELSDISLQWMMEKAQQCGLTLDSDKIPDHTPIIENQISDSYIDFLRGNYAMFNKRYYRNIGAVEYGNESIHDSVFERIHKYENYKPKNKVSTYLIGDKTPIDRLHNNI